MQKKHKCGLEYKAEKQTMHDQTVKRMQKSDILHKRKLAENDAKSNHMYYMIGSCIKQKEQST